MGTTVETASRPWSGVRDTAWWKVARELLFVGVFLYLYELIRAYGLEPDTTAFFAFSAVYGTPASIGRNAPYAEPSPAAGMKTVARYGDHDLLLSGWLEGENLIAGRSAIVDAAVGTGHVVLFGFPVQHRAQSVVTFRLLFNALFTSPQPAPVKGK